MVAVLRDAIPACSGPFRPDSQVAKILAAEYAQHVIQEVAQRVSEARWCSLAAESLLADIAASKLTHPAWVPVIGKAHRSLVRGEGELEAVAINLILEFIDSCPSTHFNCKFARPHHFVIDPIVLSKTSQLTVDWSPPELRLRSSDYFVRLTIKDGVRKQVVFDSQKACPAARTISTDCFSVWDNSTNVFAPLGSPGTRIDHREVVDVLQTAERVLCDHLGEYRAWTAPVVRYVVPATAPDGGFASGSDRHQPGAISVSFPIDPLCLLESLVHESAHQYLFLLSSFVELTDPAHDELYFSPFRGTHRPIDKILLAYHAAANIVWMYRLLIARGSPLQPSEVDLKRATGDCELLAMHLADNGGLSNCGTILFETLNGHLNSP